MAKNIATGVEHTLRNINKKQEEEVSRAWQNIRTKLDSLLLSTNVLKTNDAMMFCRKLDSMTPEERITFIEQNWGPQYLAKAQPMLIQLEMLEKRLPTGESDSNEK